MKSVRQQYSIFDEGVQGLARFAAVRLIIDLPL
jgi:hypothetical protein